MTTRDTVAVLRVWMTERAGQPDEPLFCTRRGTALSRDALERRLALHHRRAAEGCPTLTAKRLTAHTLWSPQNPGRFTLRKRLPRTLPRKRNLWRTAADPRRRGSGRLVFLEHWTDEPALAAHFAVPASTEFAIRVSELASEPPVLDVFAATRLYPAALA